MTDYIQFTFPEVKKLPQESKMLIKKIGKAHSKGFILLIYK